MTTSRYGVIAGLAGAAFAARPGGGGGVRQAVRRERGQQGRSDLLEHAGAQRRDQLMKLSTGLKARR